MKRQAVAFCLVDVAFMADPKFLALARRLPDDDDLNSAIGAFFRALAAARRNGVPDLDIQAETGSRFIPDLVAVGLLNATGFNGGPFKDWGPSAKPQQARAGRARAASAVRSPGGTFTSATSGDQRAGERWSAGPASIHTPLSTNGRDEIPGENDGEKNDGESVLGEDDPRWADGPEAPALQWLAHHGVIGVDKIGLQRDLINLVKSRDCPTVIAMFETLARDPDVRTASQFIWGADRALNRTPTPERSAGSRPATDGRTVTAEAAREAFANSMAPYLPKEEGTS